MSDTFLDMHFAKQPLQFAISGSITPISIRDQMVRAKMFVDRARAEGLISQQRALFVAGAGAGGVTAALHAAAYGIPTTLTEKNPYPFHRQKRCFSRWIDPTQYDWPAEHWHKGTYPWTSNVPLPPVTLPWAGERASLIASVWRRELDRSLNLYRGVLRFLPSTRYGGAMLAEGGQHLEVFCRPSPAGRKPVAGELAGGIACGRYGAVLLAGGFGREDVQCGEYSGLTFWDQDDFELTRLGLGYRRGPVRVLICGDGDGALQDFLRVATGLHSAGSILRQLLPYIDGALLSQLGSEEDQANRAWLWGGRASDHALQMRLDTLHRQWVQAILGHAAHGSKVRERLGRMLLHSQDVQLELIHPCGHFKALYALNRFLVHLIAEFARQEFAGGRPRIQITQQKKVGSVRGVDHRCESPHGCHGKEHAVSLVDSPNCRIKRTDQKTGTGDTGGPEQVYDAVILRLGIRKANIPKAFEKIPALQYDRHMLPYHPAV